MKITIETVATACNSQNNSGITLKLILQLLEQSQSKKSKLRKVLREMARQRMVAKKNNRYYLLTETTLPQTSSKTSKTSKGTEYVSRKNISIAILIPGATPKAFVPDSGKIVLVFILPELADSLLPWDTVQLTFRPDYSDYACTSITRHNYHVLDGSVQKGTGHFIPYGFDYLVYPLKKAHGNQAIKGVFKVQSPVSNRIPVKGRFIPKPNPPVQLKNKIKDELYQTLSLPKPFDRQVMSQSQRLPNRIIFNKNSDRIDLRKLPFITIDGETAKDFDDAVYAEKKHKGYHLYVAIADVATYVSDRSAIDIEAMQRGNSYYPVDRVIPMLPEKLSNELCSLKPNVNRNVLICELFLDVAGHPLQTKIYPAVIQSFARMTYEECDQGFKTGKWRSAKIAETVAPLLYMYREFYNVLKKKRRERGMIEFNFPDFYFDVSSDGTITDIRKYFQTTAMGIIEQFMLEANEAIAVFCQKNNIPLIWRNHLKTDLKKIKLMSSIFKNAGINTKQIQTQTGLNEVLLSLRKKGVSTATEIYLLRCMSKATYETKNRGHFGLAAEQYCHFTSPIRRYADLFNHRNILRFLRHEPMEKPNTDITKHLTNCEILAGNAEMQVQKLYRLFYAEQFIGRQFEGKITVLNHKGLIIQLGEDDLMEGVISDKLLTLMGFRYDSKNKVFHCRQTGLIMHKTLSVIIVAIDYKNLKLKLQPCL